MLHPTEMEVLNIMLKKGKPVCCYDIADGEDLKSNTVRMYIRHFLDVGYVEIVGQSRRGNRLANLYTVTDKAKNMALEQMVGDIMKLNYLITPTDVVSELIRGMEV